MFQSLVFNFGLWWLALTIFLAIYFSRPLAKVFIILISTLLIKFKPGIDLANLIFAGSAIFGVSIFYYLPFDKRLNLALSIILSLIIFLLATHFI